MATGIKKHLATSTVELLCTAGLTGSTVSLGPTNTTALFLGGSSLGTDGTDGWAPPASGVVQLRLGISEALYGVVTSGTLDLLLLATDGGLA